MKRSLLCSIAISCFIPVANGQCLMYPVALGERTALADFIVEGEVLSKRSFWSEDRSMIYTAHLIRVSKIFKGNLTGNRVEIITRGGKMGSRRILVQPALQTKIGDKGIFFGDALPAEISTSALPQWQPCAGPQGFTRYYPHANGASDVFHTYANIERELYHYIQAYTGHGFREVESLEIPTSPSFSTRMTPIIGAITPFTVAAGTDQVITLSGTHFGTYDGGVFSAVFTSNPNDGGATFEKVPDAEIISWSDTEIQLQVPSQAGSGPLQVRNASNQTGTSASNLSIEYSILQTDDQKPIYLRNTNGGGGYTISYSSNTNNGGVSFMGHAAATAFQSALDTWSCETGLNINGGGMTTSNDVNPNTAPNIIMFDNDATPLPAGVLGEAHYGLSSCDNEATWTINGFDLVFRRDGTGGINWNVGTGPTSADCTGGCVYDFQSVALHELGHVHTLGHIIAPGHVMHYNLSNGTDLRTLNPSTDVAAGNYAINLSSTYSACGGIYSGMSEASCVAPVEWLSFSGVSENRGIHLEWTTAREVNNHFFDVEHSTDGILFTSVAQVQGTGTSNQNHSYQYLHQGPENGLNFYRLKQVDLDGTFQYSRQIQVDHEITTWAEVFPNPVSETFTFRVNGWDETGKLTIRDMQGRLVFEQLVSESGLLPVSTSDWAPGIYMYELHHSFSRIEGKIIKIP